MNGQVNCREAEEKDLQQVKELWQQCFDDTESFVNWYFERYYRAEQTLGIFIQDELQASAQIIPYTLNLRGTEVPAGYIVGVDTAPEARHRGYARWLLQECLIRQRERKQVISLLMPFEGQFYYRYGWPFCYFHQQIQLKPEELRCAAKPWGTIRHCGLYEAMPELDRIYGEFCRWYQGTVCRSRQQWQLLLEDAEMDRTQCYLIEQDGVAQGYCLWTPLKGKIFIREMAWCRDEARRGMLHFLQETVPAEQTLWMELPQDDTLVYEMAVSKTAVVQYPFLMARVVDVKACLEALTYPNVSERFVLQVQDGFAAWNNGWFRVELSAGRADVVKQEESDGTADLCITVEALSQLVMGARSAAQLIRQGTLQVRSDSRISPARLEKVWPEKTLYINEYY